MLRIVFLFSLLSIWYVPANCDDSPNKVPEFKLPSIDGETVELKENGGPTVVIFLGTECPLVKQYAPLVQKLIQSKKSKIGKDLRVIGISSNRQDSLDDLKSFAKSHAIEFEIGKDYQNRVADLFGATRTPEVFLLDSDLSIVYRGRVDDQFSPGITKASASQHFLRDALKQFLSGKKIGLAKTEPVGCLIGKVRTPVKDSSITYCNQISRLLQKNCIECHRKDEIGPFALTDYEEVVGWSEMMLEVIEQKRMPPWHASADHGDFLNARSLTDKEKQTLEQWVKNGSPYGDQKDLPPAKKFTSGWDLPRKPDLQINMASVPYQIPATGIVEYQYFVVDPKFKTDKWVKAAQILPGNRSIVHHSIVFVRPPDGGRFRGIGWLSAYVPGQKPIVLPKGHARLIPAGSKLVFQQHYTTTGTVQKDLTKIGLVFADEKEIEHEVFTVAGIDQEFEIPPMKPDVQVNATVRNLPKRGKLLSLSPHMHLRGKSFKAINQNGGSRNVLCHVPQYDFNWQHIYVFRDPLDLAKIGDLNIEVHFDNSPNNPVNPDPKQTVTWGDQTHEEMAVAFFDISIPMKTSPKTKSPTVSSKPIESKASPEVAKFVDTFFKRFDKNENGVVERDETPIALRGFGFWKYDSNRDNQLTRDEVTAAAKARMK